MENLNNHNSSLYNQPNYFINEESDFVRTDENSGQRELNLTNYTSQDEKVLEENYAIISKYNLDSNPNENQENKDEDFNEEEDNLDNERQNRSYDSNSDDYENKIDQSFSGSL